MTAAETSEGLSGSLEDYLETIFHLVAEKQVAHAKDIAQRMHVRGASVTGALRSLASRGLINYAPYDVTTLTPKGEAAARDVVRRHNALREFFVKVLAIDAETADETACKMEHTMSRTVLERFLGFLAFVESCPRAGPGWVDRLDACNGRALSRKRCTRCIEETLKTLS